MSDIRQPRVRVRLPPIGAESARGAGTTATLQPAAPTTPSSGDAPATPKHAPVIDYEVGYCRPPKHSQFKPGKSGFEGRTRKKTKSLLDDLHERLQKTETHQRGGKRVTDTRLGWIIELQIVRALRNDDKATDRLIKLATMPRNDANEAEALQILSAAEEEALRTPERRAAMLEALKARRGPDDNR